MAVRKTYVRMLVLFEEDGRKIPQSVLWEDGRCFPVDRVLEVCQAASRKAGGQGERYVCMIAGSRRLLFYEDPAWFVEEKVQDS